ncbi:hypothetical protein QE152_g8456 [Popillia japonica]|uniref:Fibronectin type-III domain-containing protein n=1 Tax=Popillia japonica TaxID=7064 RepID=A0AAW1M3G0_POPJA
MSLSLTSFSRRHHLSFYVGGVVWAIAKSEQCQVLRRSHTHITDLPLPEPVAGDATIAAFQTTSLTCAPSSSNTSTALTSFPQPPTLSVAGSGSSAASPSNIITPSLSVSTSTVTKALPSTSTFIQSEFASRPDQVHNCTLLNISMTSFSIKCSEGFNGGLPQSFLLEVRESHSQEIKGNLSSPVARFSVTGLEPGALYQTALFSYNSKGRSEPVVLQAATLRLPEKQLTAEKDNKRDTFRFTPMMSVLIGVASALVIVALVVVVVLRLQCGRHDERRKRHKNGVVSTSTTEHRGSVSGPTLSDKTGGSPISKHESSGGECDSDEKNPDIIPQPTDPDDIAEFGRKRQHISTIETSPSRSLLHQAGNSAYMGYCTLRNGIPLHELSSQTKLHNTVPSVMNPYTQCTLPRQQPQWQYGPVAHLPPGVYQVPYRGTVPPQRMRNIARDQPIPMHSLTTTEEEPSVETPLVNKRESTVPPKKNRQLKLL